MADTVIHVAKTWQLTLAFLLIMFGLVMLGIRSQVNDSHIETNTRNLQFSVYHQCLDLNDANDGTNDLIEVLVQATQTNTLLTAKEKSTRIKAYTKVRIGTIQCTPPK